MKFSSPLKLNHIFRRLYATQGFANGMLVLYARPNRLGVNRVGITTGKKIGCAVQRSRARRVIREGVRPLISQIGGYDIVFVARTRTPEMKSTQLTPVILKHLKQLGVITA